MQKIHYSARLVEYDNESITYCFSDKNGPRFFSQYFFNDNCDVIDIDIYSVFQQRVDRVISERVSRQFKARAQFHYINI